MGDYYLRDLSKDVLKFEDPRFPAYLRLFKWKVLDICVNDSSKEAFRMFEKIFGETELHNLLTRMLHTKQVVEHEKPNMNCPPIDRERFPENDKYQAALKMREAMIADLKDFEIQLVRKRCTHSFFSKIMYNEEGLRTVDQMLYRFDLETYRLVHWAKFADKLPEESLFFEKFYDPVDENDRFKTQLLDRVSTAARGNFIYSFFVNNQQFEFEKEKIDVVITDPKRRLVTDLVNCVLYEGPQNYIEHLSDGTERRVENRGMFGGDKWTTHHTLLLFASLPLMDTSSREKVKGDWYYNLLEAMSRDPHNRAGLWWLQRDYEQILEEKEKERQRLRSLKLEGINEKDEEAVNENDEAREIRPQPRYDFEMIEDFEHLNLRSYQEELVLPVIRGNNTVVVAPTGSGKTEVAIYAALKHIEERAEKKLASRVVMLVPKIPLVGQQKDRFLKYCRGKYYVEGLHGSESSSSGRGRKEDVLRAHVVVMTPQILINMWQSVRESEKLYVCDFSMVIFDEVHKTTKNHPYGEIAHMIEFYNGTKPQVVGMTASLNVSAKSTYDSQIMLTEIYKLFATLGAMVLSAIQDPANIAELNKHISKPDDSVFVCQPPVRERSTIRSALIQYHSQLNTKLMDEIERLAKGRGQVFPAYFVANTKRMQKIQGAMDDIFAYENWLQQVVQHLNKINSNEKVVAHAITKCLKIVIEARGIIDVMPPYVAFDFVSEKLEDLNEHLPQLTENFKKILKNLEKNKHEADSNEEPEIVQKLKETLQAQFQSNPDSRAIIFVTQRSTAERVCYFLNRSKVLKMDGTREAFGYVLGSNNQGIVKQSATEQKAVIERFNNGKLKVIVATSVVEEGLDVAACNLIIKYNCSSGSAIQLVQQKGRARSKNSRSVLLVVYSKVKQNENNALIAEKYMRQCVQAILKLSANQFKTYVDQEKLKLKRLLETEAQNRKSREAELQSKLYTLSCARCNTEFCKSDAIKKIYSNYMIMDPDVWHKFELENRKRSKFQSEDTQPLCNLKCATCKDVTGKAFKQRGVYVPQLDVKVVTFSEANTTHPQMETKSNWTSVENELFYIAEARDSHFRSMLNALNDSEKNLEKKKMLDCESKQIGKELENKEKKEREAREREEKKQRERNSQLKHEWDYDEEEDEEEANPDENSDANLKKNDWEA